MGAGQVCAELPVKVCSGIHSNSSHSSEAQDFSYCHFAYVQSFTEEGLNATAFPHKVKIPVMSQYEHLLKKYTKVANKNSDLIELEQLTQLMACMVPLIDTSVIIAVIACHGCCVP